MKLWHGILLIVGVLAVIGGLLTLILPIDNPQYATGEASAMVERIYDLPSYTMTELYLGEGVWQVVSLYSGAIFRVYEETNTMIPYNSIARYWLDRQNTEAEKPTIVPTRPKFPWE